MVTKFVFRTPEVSKMKQESKLLGNVQGQRKYLAVVEFLGGCHKNNLILIIFFLRLPNVFIFPLYCIITFANAQR